MEGFAEALVTATREVEVFVKETCLWSRTAEMTVSAGLQYKYILHTKISAMLFIGHGCGKMGELGWRICEGSSLMRRMFRYFCCLFLSIVEPVKR